ncbi:hypothetical protein OKJ48_18160 [Streptomyces kunmingensis]|uniref:Condensation domain-containing protein n=1 Tax=Streptomyces kunmingensis TaxID=68225 RepID=A0ABU6CBT1_9ACTN|nr:condensation domain-containing protein [Streptomyces kunmingensis]MEB3962159.1 hypothetical protein [Streptomyces kunmingensis]
MPFVTDHPSVAQAGPTASTRFDGTQPGTPVQEIVRDLFAEAAGLPRAAVGADSDFFRLGGQAPGAARRLLGRLTQTFAVAPGHAELRTASTPVRLAALLGDARATALGPRCAAEFSTVLPLRLRGRLDEHALDQALKDLGERHEALRNSRLGVAGTRLCRLGADDLSLELALPADSVDLWSQLPLAAELARAYTARTADRAPHRQRCRPDTVPHPRWGDREPSAVPGSTPGDGAAGRAELSWWLPPALHTRLARCAARHGATLFIVVYAALAEVLSRWGAGPRITVAAPVPARDSAALRAAVGPYGRVLALSVDTAGAADFGELLGRAGASALTAYRSGTAPLAEPGGVALTVLQSMPTPVEAENLTITPERPTLAAHAAGLSLTLTEHQTPHGQPAGLSLAASWLPGVLDETVAGALCRDLVAALEAAPATPASRSRGTGGRGVRAGAVPAPVLAAAGRTPSGVG